MKQCPACQSYNLGSATACAYCKAPLEAAPDPFAPTPVAAPPEPAPEVSAPEPEPEPEPVVASVPASPPKAVPAIEVPLPEPTPAPERPSRHPVQRLLGLCLVTVAGTIAVITVSVSIQDSSSVEEEAVAPATAAPTPSPVPSPRPTPTPHHGPAPKLPAARIQPFAGSGTAGFLDGSATKAQFQYPRSLAVDKAGNVYVGDSYNGCIRRITPKGEVSTFAGGSAPPRPGTVVAFQDGPRLQAGFGMVHGMAFDSRGRLFVADSGNNAVRVVETSGQVRTFKTFEDKGYVWMGMAIDAHDNLYLGADSGARGGSTVFRLTPKGEVSEAVPKGAGLIAVGGVAIDRKGNLYVADHVGARILRVTSKGAVSVFAGSAELPSDPYNNAVFQKPPSADGWGTEAAFQSPLGLAVDRQGHVWVADSPDRTVRRITPDGYVKTVVRHRDLADPYYIAIGPRDEMYLLDEAGHRVYRLMPQ